MRKLMAMLLAILMIMSMAACGTDDIEETTEATQGTTTPQETASSNPLLAAELQRGVVRNGSDTETIGVYAYIKISKEDLRDVAEEEYLEFCKAEVDSGVYNWVSIICDDHTGIQFTGAQYTLATYGRISVKGIIIEDIGYIRQTTNGFIYEPAK